MMEWRDIEGGYLCGEFRNEINLISNGSSENTSKEKCQQALRLGVSPLPIDTADMSVLSLKYPPLRQLSCMCFLCRKAENTYLREKEIA